jgi:hypothetical protein
VGVHAWLNGTTRLTANARYYVTEEGRKDDFWYIGLSIGWLFGGEPDRETVIEVEEWIDDEAEVEDSSAVHAGYSVEPSKAQGSVRVIDGTGLILGSDVE